jgi:iron complex transport system ATP-binding protein
LVIQVSQLIADYGQKSLIRNLSFTLSIPSFIAIVGHNGSGKTTFFKALSGQIPYQGEIYFYQQSARSFTNLTRSEIIAVLEQKNQVGFGIRVLDLVVMGRFRKKKFLENYHTEDYAQARAALQTLGVASLAEKDFLLLSGGEQQMVWLAQLMMQDAAIYLLDEPTQQLDVRNKKRVFEYMQQWVNRDQKTVFCITHDLHYLFQMEGYLLNLSEPNPQLRRLDQQSVQECLDFLEK